VVWARSGDVEVVREGMASGRFDPRACLDRNGASGLLWAAGFGNLEVCKLLVAGELGIRARDHVQLARRG
jgi:hypothetical protein